MVRHFSVVARASRRAASTIVSTFSRARRQTSIRMESWKHAPHTHQNFRICTLLIVLASASAQTPQFEVASVKISVPPSSGRMAVFSSGGPGTKDPSRYRCENCALSGLMLDAFPLEEYQISEPEWMQSARFTISAKVPEGATKEQFRLMMQNLLIDRFQLKFHYEKKETQSYELVVLKNGPKMKESEGGLHFFQRRVVSPHLKNVRRRCIGA